MADIDTSQITIVQAIPAYFDYRTPETHGEYIGPRMSSSKVTPSKFTLSPKVYEAWAMGLVLKGTAEELNAAKEKLADDSYDMPSRFRPDRLKQYVSVVHNYDGDPNQMLVTKSGSGFAERDSNGALETSVLFPDFAYNVFADLGLNGITCTPFVKEGAKGYFFPKINIMADHSPDDQVNRLLTVSMTGANNDIHKLVHRRGLTNTKDLYYGIGWYTNRLPITISFTPSSYLKTRQEAEETAVRIATAYNQRLAKHAPAPA